MIDIYILEQLVAFADAGTLSGASKIVGISQPALSGSMKKLEDILEVKLFDRSSNRIYLNETGRLAVKLAREILEAGHDMQERLKRFDRSRKTISFASCAPVPMMDVLPLMKELYDGMRITSELVGDDAEIINGVADSTYRFGVIHTPLTAEQMAEELYSRMYKSEKLFLSVPLSHPLADRDRITFADIDGQNLLLYSGIGFWYSLVKEKLPNAHFLMMDDYDTFNILAGTEAFPSFATDVILRNSPEIKDKKIIPITDEDAGTGYYIVMRKNDMEFFKPLTDSLK